VQGQPFTPSVPNAIPLPDLADRISDARGQGLARASEDALVGTVTGAYDLLRFSYLGYRRLFAVATDEEEAERVLPSCWRWILKDW